MKRIANNRCLAYEHLFKEISFDNQTLSYFNQQDNPNYTNPNQEQIFQLQEQLQSKIIQLAQHILSPQKYRIFYAFVQGIPDNLTQWEIADQLNLNQSTIYKALYGGYRNVRTKNMFRRVYDKGAFLLIKEAAANNEEIQQLLHNIYELNND